MGATGRSVAESGEERGLRVMPDAARHGAARVLPGIGCPPIALNHVWPAGVLTSGFIVGALVPAEQRDYGWTVKLGEGFWASGQLPTSDPLALTATRQPCVEQQWLAQVAVAVAHHRGGLEAALRLRGALLVLAIGRPFQACRRAGAVSGAVAVAACVAMHSVVGGAAIRPQLPATPLFLLVVLGTMARTGGPWTLGRRPLAMVVWANVHGSFVLGLVLVLLPLLGRLPVVADEQPASRVVGAAAAYLPEAFTAHPDWRLACCDVVSLVYVPRRQESALPVACSGAR